MGGRILGAETSHSHARRLREGFYERYLSGERILDIGYRGGTPDAEPVVPQAIGVELDYPGYDGITLPFSDQSQDAVFASHCLEHIRDYRMVLRDWFRVLRAGGYLVISVPNRYLYEKRAALPSRFNAAHCRFYSPASLLAEIEGTLPEGQFRVRALRDIDDGFKYDQPQEAHPAGSYEIELVLEKIEPPAYVAELESATKDSLAEFVAEHCRTAMADLEAGNSGSHYASIIRMLSRLELPHFRAVRNVLDARHGTILTEEEDELLKTVYRDAGVLAPFNAGVYRSNYPDLAHMDDVQAQEHWERCGYFEGRFATP